MKYRTFTRFATLGACLVLVNGINLNAQTPPTVLSSGHADVGLAYEDGLWNLHVHDHDNDIEYAPDQAILRLNPNSARPIPLGASYSFLGAAGSTFYVLPQIQEDNLLFLGLAAEEVLPGDFTGNTMRMTLRSVSGPGNFSVYSVDGFGSPTVFMNSGNGIAGASDFINVAAGSHADYNWAFSAPGSYTIGFEATGTHSTDGPVASGTVNYSFEVVPEPGTWALSGMGAVLLFGLGLRKKH